MGAAEHPLSLTYALWNGAAWSAPQSAVSGLQNVLGVAAAAHTATQATLVYSVDGDVDLLTAGDRELYASSYDGTAWSQPMRLTTDSVSDAAPSLAYDTAGRLHLVWLRDGQPVWRKDAGDAAAALALPVTNVTAGLLRPAFVRSPDGLLALVWQVMGAQGADLAYAVYDGAADQWSGDTTLMQNADVEAAPSLAFGSDTSLYVAYEKVATQFVTQTFTITGTETVTVTNFPKAGSSDLAFLAHVTQSKDLILESLAVSPAQAAAGQQAALTAWVRNASDLAVSNVAVDFYAGGQSIGTAHISGYLSGRAAAPMQLLWQIPTPSVTHTLRALVDPQNRLAEGDETNNEQTISFTPGAGAPLELSAVTVSGPVDGVAGTSYIFTATISPITATTPITYTWQATEQVPIAHSGGVTDTARFTWAMAGTKAITVTAASPRGLVVGTHSLTAAANEPDRLYLPAVRR